MDLGLNRRRRHQRVIPDANKDLYPHDMNFYRLPPVGDIHISEFEELALERLKVLRILEFATHKGFKMYSPEWKAFVHEELHKQNLRKFLRLIKSNGASNPNDLDYQARRADYISHFILRIAYCRTPELHRWFLNLEVDLFKLRYQELSPQSAAQFLELNNLHYDPISDEEKDQYRDELNGSTGSFFVFETTPFYKVPFTQVLNLVTTMRVFLRGGTAYVPHFELISCIVSVFRAKLDENLSYARSQLPFFGDDRVNGLLNDLHKMYTGIDYKEHAGVVNIYDLNKYALAHYPPCMRHIHDMFRANHHLKYGARLQYVVFLKAIGVTLENCLKFWKEEFTKKMDEDKFDKQYAYSVKHLYGKVGRMKSHAPYSCLRIITSSPGPGDCHGCPFKDWDASFLKQKLFEYGIKNRDVDDISAIAAKGHCQIACSKYFEVTHGQENKNGINHPNQYFDDSLSLANPTLVAVPRGSQPKTEKSDNSVPTGINSSQPRIETDNNLSTAGLTDSQPKKAKTDEDLIATPGPSGAQTEDQMDIDV